MVIKKIINRKTVALAAVFFVEKINMGFVYYFKVFKIKITYGNRK